jgi:hypothetical protein
VLSRVSVIRLSPSAVSKAVVLAAKVFQRILIKLGGKSAENSTWVSGTLRPQN